MFFISIYKPNAILMKAPAVFLLELENLFLKCKWNNKWWRRTKPHQKNKLGVLALLDVVSVHLGSCNKISQSGELINNRNTFLTVLEVGSLRSGCQHGLVRVPFWVADFLLYPYIAEGAREPCGTFIKNTNPFLKAPLS